MSTHDDSNLIITTILFGVVRGVLQQAVVCGLVLFIIEIVIVGNSGRRQRRRKSSSSSGDDDGEQTQQQQEQQQQTKQSSSPTVNNINQSNNNNNHHQHKQYHESTTITTVPTKPQIQPNVNRFAKVWSHEIPHGIWTVAGGYCIKLLFQYLIGAGYVRVIPISLSSSFATTTTATIAVATANVMMLLLRWFVEVVVYFIFFDAYFYFGHWYLHTNRTLYNWIHKSHHESTAPNVIVGVSFHPIEGIIFGSFLSMYATIVTWLTGGTGILQPTLVACGAIQLFQSFIIHCGYEFCTSKHFESNNVWSLFVTPTFHDRHHERYHCNYGGFFTYLDDYFGTADHCWRTKYATWQRYGRTTNKQQKPYKVQ